MKKAAEILTYGYPVKKGMRFLCLLIFFVAVHSFAVAQQVRAKWLDNLTTSATGHSQVWDIKVDNQSNIYVTGTFQDTVNVNPQGTAKYLYTKNSQALFAAKYKEDGTLIWAENFLSDTASNSAAARPLSIAIDKNANISISGYFDNKVLDADPGPGVYNLYGYRETGFVIHLDSAGNFLWAHNTGDNSYEGCIQASSDSQDDVIATSTFRTTDTVGTTIYTIPTTYCHGLIVKYDPAGNVLWSVNLGNNSAGDVLAFGCKTDNQDNIIVTGTFNNTVDFNPLGTPYNLTATSPGQYFFAKYSPAGVLIWLNVITTGSQFPEGLTDPLVSTDQLNNIYLSISFTQFITFNSTTTINVQGYEDVAFAKYSPSGILQYAKDIGGPSPPPGSDNGSPTYTLGYNMNTDLNNDLYITGTFCHTVNFDPNGTHTLTHTVSNLFLAKYDVNGNYIDAFTLSGDNNLCGNTSGFGMAVDNDNNLNMVGQFCAYAHFDASGCLADSVATTNNFVDGFIVQYGPIAVANDSIAPPAVNSFCAAGASPGTITGSLPTGGGGVYTYQWQSSADSVSFVNINGATAQDYSPPSLNATTYYQRIVSAGTCTPPITSNVAKLNITILPVLAAPEVKVAATTSSSIIFAWAAVPGATGYEVSTDNGETYTPVSGLTDTIGGLKTGQSVTIMVKATGSTVCQLSPASDAVTGKTIDIIYCPNAFTPNGDSRNDKWDVEGENIASVKFFIYDQWGELLFTSTSLQNGWDGTYKGAKEPVGVYAYYMEAVMNDGSKINKKGTINLLK